MNRNKFVALSCCLALIFFLGTVSLAAADEAEPKVGQTVGNVTFTGTITPEESTYLGLANPGPFSWKDVKAPYVLVEQFNTSCPHCMHQAPFMNQLFDKVQGDPQLKNKLKFIGAGQGTWANKRIDLAGVLSPQEYAAISPAWSPDGTRLATAGRRP